MYYTVFLFADFTTNMVFSCTRGFRPKNHCPHFKSTLQENQGLLLFFIPSSVHHLTLSIYNGIIQGHVNGLDHVQSVFSCPPLSLTLSHTSPRLLPSLFLSPALLLPVSTAHSHALLLSFPPRSLSIRPLHSYILWIEMRRLFSLLMFPSACISITVLLFSCFQINFSTFSC